MPKSAAFARIKNEILSIVEAIPPGRVTTYKAVGVALKVMPRHVSYILVTLNETDSELPWHRVVGDGGKITAHKLAQEQTRLLEFEGIICHAGTINDFTTIFISPDDLSVKLIFLRAG